MLSNLEINEKVYHGIEYVEYKQLWAPTCMVHNMAKWSPLGVLCTPKVSELSYIWKISLYFTTETIVQ